MTEDPYDSALWAPAGDGLGDDWQWLDEWQGDEKSMIRQIRVGEFAYAIQLDGEILRHAQTSKTMADIYLEQALQCLRRDMEARRLSQS